ncbi:TetR family transcriptional regulator C-terminal domain-containing protein [Pseudoroseomonas globiformis]|uniref:TetR family transcriptional regulator C-terminal domain-containing protein n=1 Tax=Teichococcus globiformis TaxID=2307229 RepID=A0ABV7GAB4_9PROT
MPCEPAPRRRAQQRLAQILNAAEGVFAQADFRGANMAAIAAAAGLPKAILHCYFGTKEALYTELLDNILSLWLSATAPIRPEADPAFALESYIRDKMQCPGSVRWPRGSPPMKCCTGAQYLRSHLAGPLRRRAAEKSAVLQGWMDQGRMRPVIPLIFSLQSGR